jgi:galactose mutarotase-like enzyme
MSQQHSEWIRISSGELSAQIDPQGAQLSALIDAAGHDLLWNGDPSVWTGRAPLLFPIVGALAGGSYRIGGHSYALPRHGFARTSRFRVMQATAGSAVFRLEADEVSRRIYPFEFALDMHFELAGPTLSLTAWVRNLGQGQMPASFGYHPALRWPLPFGQPREAHYIEFASDEPAPVRRLGPDGLLRPERQPTPIAGRRLPLADSLFRDDVVIFDEIRSRSVTYGAQSGPRIRIDFPDAPCLAIWTRPGAPFICIEPWHGIADPQGYSGDFTAKPGVFSVAAGAAMAIQMTLTLLT